MTISHTSRLLLPLLLLIFLLAPWQASANSIVDDLDRTWRSTSIEVGGAMQVRIDITDAGGQLPPFWATTTGDNIEAFLFSFSDPILGEEIWMVWSRERISIPGTFDIFQRRLNEDGEPGHLGVLVQVTKADGVVEYSDQKPVAAACPLGHHIGFQRETTTQSGTNRVISYLNNVINNGSSDGTWPNAILEQIELPGGHSGSDITLLLGNENDGSPTVAIFKDWVTRYHLSGLKSRKAHISIWKRVVDGPGDPNPWEKIRAYLPDNPEVH